MLVAVELQTLSGEKKIEFTFHHRWCNFVVVVASSRARQTTAPQSQWRENVNKHERGEHISQIELPRSTINAETNC
jgi:hypothetical protein